MTSTCLNLAEGHMYTRDDAGRRAAELAVVFHLPRVSNLRASYYGAKDYDLGMLLMERNTPADIDDVVQSVTLGGTSSVVPIEKSAFELKAKVKQMFERPATVFKSGHSGIKIPFDLELADSKYAVPTRRCEDPDETPQLAQNDPDGIHDKHHALADAQVLAVKDHRTMCIWCQPMNASNSFYGMIKSTTTAVAPDNYMVVPDDPDNVGICVFTTHKRKKLPARRSSRKPKRSHKEAKPSPKKINDSEGSYAWFVIMYVHTKTDSIPHSRLVTCTLCKYHQMS